MPSIFNTDRKTDQLIRRFERDMPRQFQYSAAGVINSQAFQARESMIQTINKEMEVRSPAFVKRQVRVTKTDPRTPINRQFALAGSVRAKGFSGWVEQETGKAPDKNYVPTSYARGQNFSNKIPHAFRLKSGRTLATRGDYVSKRYPTRGQSTMAMIRAAQMGKLKKPFIIESGLPGDLERMQSGLYTIFRGWPRRVQTFKKKFRTKRNNWMGESLYSLDQEFSPKKEWVKQMEKRLAKMRNRR